MPDAKTKTLKTSILSATNLYLVTHAQTRNASTEEVNAVNGNLQFRKDYTETPTETCYVFQGCLSFYAWKICLDFYFPVRSLTYLWGKKKSKKHPKRRRKRTYYSLQVKKSLDHTL